MGINDYDEVMYKLNALGGSGKLLFNVADKYYVLCSYDTVRKSKDNSLFEGAIRYFHEMHEAYIRDLWNEETERFLLKSMHRVIVFLEDWDTSPDETRKIILSFNNDHLYILEQQIDMYVRIKELFRKYKSWR